MKEHQTVARMLYAFVALATASTAFFLTEGDVSSAGHRLAEAYARELSDEVIFAGRGELQRERERLLRRHRALVEGGAQSQFVRALAATARRHGVRLLAADVTTNPSLSPNRRATNENLAEVHAQLRLRGPYSQLLRTIDELAREADSVRLDVPSLHADGPDVDATLPLAISQALPTVPLTISSPAPPATIAVPAPPVTTR